MKYEAQSQEIKRMLEGANKVLIALPVETDTDSLAAGLALFLTLQQAQKEVSIVTESTVRVSHTNLYGVGSIQSTLPQVAGGNMTLTLKGVGVNGEVPSVERLDYNTVGSDLNLVFLVKPGQKFEPIDISHNYETGNFDLIFTIGSISLDALGGMYKNNSNVFSQSPVVNIDIKALNQQYGVVNLGDSTVSSLSELVGQVIFDLQMPIEQDGSTNLLNGIFEATQNLSSDKVGADTYHIVAESIRKGGVKPAISAQLSAFRQEEAIETAAADAVPRVTEIATQPEVVQTQQPSVSEQTSQVLTQTVQQPIAPSTSSAFSQFIQPAGGINLPPVTAPQSDTIQTHQDTPPQHQIPSEPIATPSTGGSPERVAEQAPAPQEQVAPTPEQAPSPQEQTQAAPESPTIDEQPSLEEVVSGERVVSGEQAMEPEPDWLTPKVFKGGSIG
jgi:nanoRNase/pAp phosphatase (c-di-AMP/oligoRNAs hydrolase)